MFSSDRPRESGAKSAARDFDLWAMDRTGEAWSDPQNLGSAVNSPANDAYPSIAADGTLYFSSSREGGKGGPDIYRARFVDGHYTEAENVAEVNGPGYDSQPAIAPDQAFLVFASIGRSDAMADGGAPYPRSDLYVSFRGANGWTMPRNLGAPINTAASEGSPSISADGKWLFFSSDRSFVTIPMRTRMTAREFESNLHGLFNGWSNVYRVPASAVTAIARDRVARP